MTRQPRRGPRWSTTARVAAALATALAAATGFGAAAAATPGAATQEAKPTVVLESATTALEPNGAFHLSVQVANAPADATVQLSVFDRIDNAGSTASRQRLEQAVDGDGLRNRRTPQSPPTPVPPSGLVSFDLDSSTAANQTFLRTAPGLYPVEVALLPAKGSKKLAQLVTFFARLPDPTKAHPLPVALVVPLTSDPTLQPDGTRSVAPGTALLLRDLAAMLAAHPGVPVTVRVSPELVTTLTTTDSAADLQTAVKAAVTPGRELLAGTYVPLSPTDWLEANLGNELGAEYDRGTAALGALGPTDESLLLGDGSITQQTVDALAVFRHTSRVVVPAAALENQPAVPPKGVVQLSPPPDGAAAVQALVVDPLITRFATTGSGDPALDANHLVAALSLAALNNDGTAATAVPLPDQIDPDILGAVLTALGSDPAQGANRLLHAVTAADAFSTPSKPASSTGSAAAAGDDLPSASLRAPTGQAPSAAMRALASRLQGAEPDIDEYRLLAPDDTAGLDRLQEQLLVSGSQTLSPEQQQAHIAAVGTGIGALTALVRAPDHQDIRLTAREGVIPLVFHNDSNTAIQLTVHLESDRLRFPEAPDNTLQLRLPAGEQAFRTDLRVEALTSGSSLLKVTTTSPTGRFVIGNSRVTVRSFAISWVGKVLLVGSGLFLILWWGSHIHKDRRRRGDGPAAGPDEPAGGGGDDGSVRAGPVPAAHGPPVGGH